MRFDLGRPNAAIRAAEEARIDAEAAAMAETVRPSSLARMDAARLEQARVAALLEGDEYASSVPLIAGMPGGGTLAEKASTVLAAAASTDRQMVAIEAARLAAKAELRAAGTTAEMRNVRLQPRA